MAERWSFEVVVAGGEFICQCGVWVGGGFALEHEKGLALCRAFCLACAERRVRAAARHGVEEPQGPMDPRVAFGKRLRYEREKAGLALPELAAVVGWASSWLSDVERGLPSPACFSAGVVIADLTAILGALSERGASDEACGELFRWWRASL